MPRDSDSNILCDATKKKIPACRLYVISRVNRTNLLSVLRVQAKISKQRLVISHVQTDALKCKIV